MTTISLAYFLTQKFKIQLMKKGLLLFVCVLALTTLSQAQVRFGVKAGINLANVSGDDVDGNSMKIGFNAGAVAKISVSEAFSIQPEIVYSDQGAKLEDDVKLNLSYINIPILAQYNTGGFIIETGPQFGFRMGAKLKGDGGSLDLKEQTKGFDLGWGIGVGYLTQSGFGVNARYNLGLSNIADDDDGDLKNSVIQIGVFYLFSGGGSAKK
jgi:hypothetical protein